MSVSPKAGESSCFIGVSMGVVWPSLSLSLPLIVIVFLSSTIGTEATGSPSLKLSLSTCAGSLTPSLIFCKSPEEDYRLVQWEHLETQEEHLKRVDCHSL